MIEQKQCPKCTVYHNKSGKFCSRHCANSRVWTDEINAKRRINNQKSGVAFWCTSPRAEQLRLLRRRTATCTVCGIEISSNRKTCSTNCLHVLRGSKNINRKIKSIQRLKSERLPDHIIPIELPTHGTPGRSSTYEGELARRRKISDKAKKNNGGYRHGSGRGIKGWYKGMFCDSSWELAFVLWSEMHNKDIERNKSTFAYIWNDKIRKYLPDFIVDNQFVEIKGWLSPQNQAKISQFPHDKYQLNVYTEAHMKPIISEVIQRYGKDFVRLYNTESEPDERTGTVLKTVGTPEGFAGRD